MVQGRRGLVCSMADQLDYKVHLSNFGGGAHSKAPHNFTESTFPTLSPVLSLSQLESKRGAESCGFVPPPCGRVYFPPWDLVYSLLVILSIPLLVALSLLLLCNVCPPACCLVYTLPVILVSSLYEMLFSCLLTGLFPACNLVYPPPCLLHVVWGGVLWLCDQTERKQYQTSASKYFQSTIPSSVC